MSKYVNTLEKGNFNAVVIFLVHLSHSSKQFIFYKCISESSILQNTISIETIMKEYENIMFWIADCNNRSTENRSEQVEKPECQQDSDIDSKPDHNDDDDDDDANKKDDEDTETEKAAVDETADDTLIAEGKNPQCLHGH